jgi:hypothetical protein
MHCRRQLLQETLLLAGIAEPLQERLQLAGNMPQLAGTTEAECKVPLLLIIRSDPW